MNDCVYLDKETGWCKKHSDWSDAMPVLEYCLESPCCDYRPLKDDNLDDLISRSAAIEALTNAMSMTGYQSRAIDAVRFLPTTEAKTVRHGRWIEDGCYNTCSLCGSSFDRYDDGGYYQDFDNCPKCGQPMDAKDIGVPGKICPATKLPCCDCVPGTPCAKMDGGSK